jgi:hypothetical protein
MRKREITFKVRFFSPCNYRFRVMACNNSGIWNEAGTFLDISIAPAYYQTNWLSALCTAAFLALLWGVYRLRVQQSRYQERKLRDVIQTIPTFAWTALPDGSDDFVNRQGTNTQVLPKSPRLFGWHRRTSSPSSRGRISNHWTGALGSH